MNPKITRRKIKSGLKEAKIKELLFILLRIIERKRGEERNHLIKRAKQEIGAIFFSNKTIFIWVENPEIREELFTKIETKRKIIKGQGPEVGGLLLITFEKEVSEQDIEDLLAFFISDLTNAFVDIYFLTSTRNHSNNGSIRRFTTSDKRLWPNLS